MKILITGSNGFIGKNLVIRLKEIGKYQIINFTKKNNLTYLKKHITDDVDLIVHLAGENRPKDTEMFEKTNIGLSNYICEIVAKTGRNIPIIFSSSTQALDKNPYGQSKLAAEKLFNNLAVNYGVTILAIRLCGVFGKWSKPNYNSVISTWCFNAVNDLPIDINNPDDSLNLLYIDDVVEMVINQINSIDSYKGFNLIENHKVYKKKLIDIANLIKSFANSRENIKIEQVGSGFKRALYSTYLSYIKPEDFKYKLHQNIDRRGSFVEMLKTSDSGQFSFFTAHPGITRGGHYHHTKSEKFLVIKGSARFCFRNIDTNETYELTTSDELPEVVETIPGWSHDITNIGDKDMIVMLWANEVFNKNKPDTISYKT